MRRWRRRLRLNPLKKSLRVLGALRERKLRDRHKDPKPTYRRTRYNWDR
jgi:hypothetical protein